MKKRTHWWLLVWRGSGIHAGCAEKREHVRYQKRTYARPYELEIIKVVRAK